MSRPSPAKRWCFTWHVPSEMTEDAAWPYAVERLTECKKIDWAFFGRETTQTGGKHAQGFLYTSRKMRLTELVKVLPGAHFELARGTDKENWDYCTKQDKQPKLIGPVPQADSFKKKGDNMKQVWDETLQLAQAGRVDEIRSDILIRYRGTLKQIAAENAPKPKRLKAKSNIWVWGPPGSGKTQLVKSEHEGYSVYLKSTDQWWEHYNGETIVIVEDIDPTNFEKEKDLKRLIKLWADVDSFEARIKGSSLGHIRPKRIVVTSNYSIEQVFGHAQDYEAFTRRFKSRYIEDFKEYTAKGGELVNDFYNEVLEEPDYVDLAALEEVDDEDEVTEAQDEVMEVMEETSSTQTTINILSDDEEPEQCYSQAIDLSQDILEDSSDDIDSFLSGDY